MEDSMEYERLTLLAERCLTTPALADQLCALIYDRLQADLRIQRERSNPSIGRV